MHGAINLRERKFDESIASLPGTSLQSHPTLCGPSGFSVHGILQARVLECVAMPLQAIKTLSLMPPELADKSIRDSVLVQIQASWDAFWDTLRPAPVDATAPS